MSVQITEKKHIHGNILKEKTSKLKGAEYSVFSDILRAYELFRTHIESIETLTDDNLRRMVDILNEYRRSSIPHFDMIDNTGQSGLGSTILEEFFYLLFQKEVDAMGLTNENLFIGKGNSYVSLSFAPISFLDTINNPKAYIHTKDQDFVLGANIEIHVVAEDNSEIHKTTVPIIAIECKTYLERNMLDACAATASRLKKAMPYCIFIVAMEYLKMDDASPELTDIDEVYVLCRAKNSERENRQKNNEPPLDIHADLIIDLYYRVKRHLNAIWWTPDNAVEHGKIINRPR